MIPAAQRVLGEYNYSTLSMKKIYASALGLAVLSKGLSKLTDMADKGNDATFDDIDDLDDLYEATARLEETARIARRVLGPSILLVKSIERDLRVFQNFLSQFDKPPTSA